MATAAVITYEDPLSGSWVVIDFDVISNETHTLGATVSDHPVEAGVDISDHVRPQLLQLAITGVVSDTPIRRSILPGDTQPNMETLSSTALDTVETKLQKSVSVSGAPGGGALDDTVNSIPGVGALRRQNRSVNSNMSASPATYSKANVSQGFQFRTFETGRVRQVFEQLEKVCRNGVPVQVVTSVRTYPNMLITSVRADRAPTESLAFEMELREFRVATVANTTVTRTPQKKKKPAETRGEKTTDQGDQATPPGLEVGKSGARATIQALAENAQRFLNK